MCLAVQTIQGPPDEKEKRKEMEKEKAEDDPKGPEEHFFGDEQAQDPEWWLEEDLVWWSKGKKGKQGWSKGNDGLQIRVVFARTSPTKVQAMTFTIAKAEERVKKEKAKKELFLNRDSQPQIHPMKKDMAKPENQTIGLPVTGLMVPGLQMLGGSVQSLKHHGWWQQVNHPTHVVLGLGSTRSIGSRTAVERFSKHAWY